MGVRDKVLSTTYAKAEIVENERIMCSILLIKENLEIYFKNILKPQSLNITNYYCVSDNALSANLLEHSFPAIRKCCTFHSGGYAACDVPSLSGNSRNFFVFVCLCAELVLRGLQFHELKSHELFHTGVLLRMVNKCCNTIDVALQLSSR